MPCLHPFFPCLLSAEIRRMGRDKALLPHPAGGTLLEQSLRLLASAAARHPAQPHPSHGRSPVQILQQQGFELEGS